MELKGFDTITVECSENEICITQFDSCDDPVRIYFPVYVAHEIISMIEKSIQEKN